MDTVVSRLADRAYDGTRSHVVICLFNAMGDAFLALPVIRFVIDKFGRNRVSVWANEYHGKTVYAELGEIFIASSECSRNIAADRKEEELTALRRRLPSDRAVIWVSLNPYAPRTEVEDHAIANIQPESLWEFRGMHLRVDDRTGELFHRIDQYFRVIGEHRPPTVDRRPLIDSITRKRAEMIRDHVHQTSKRLLAVHSQTRPSKCWPDSYWRELSDLLRPGYELLLLGLPGQALSRTGNFLTAPHMWAKQVAILAHADAFIGIDSCFSHVADAFNVPGFVLYGDTPMLEQWTPKGPALKALIAAEGKLESLAADEVADRVQSQLGLFNGAAGIEVTSVN